MENTALTEALSQTFTPREIEIFLASFTPRYGHWEGVRFVGDVHSVGKRTVSSGREIVDAIKSILGDQADDVLLTGMALGERVRWRFVDYNVATDTTEGPLRVVTHRRKYGEASDQAYPT